MKTHLLLILLVLFGLSACTGGQVFLQDGTPLRNAEIEIWYLDNACEWQRATTEVNKDGLFVFYEDYNGYTIPEGTVMIDIHSVNEYWHYTLTTLQVSDNKGTAFKTIPLKGEYLERYVDHKYDYTCDNNGEPVKCRNYKITVKAMEPGIKGASLVDWVVWEGLKEQCLNMAGATKAKLYDEQKPDAIYQSAYAVDIDAMIAQQEAFQMEMMSNIVKSNVSKALSDIQKDIARKMK